MREIHIHIGEVVLDGAAGSDPADLLAGLEGELRALARDHGGPYPSGHAAHLDGRPVTAPPGGADVARSAWRSIVGGPGAAS
ncbi:hypothetical protein E1264_14670 [Actinomadura sp. KC216]|uniref:hypothetical protein n=1 Tax=Actinomadura sp. KC216 TaxID=2530370 RepID=UPI001042B099|nr:hypothetical protein [Actinomadura sp. KC216]TDB87405.1 hypothetical protein E1264_14670 [Actinomadura sp. KC216]